MIRLMRDKSLAWSERIRSHKDLMVWAAAVALVENVYQRTASFPRREIFGLTSQIRRSAVSVASNIAEGSARKTRAEFVHFLHIARGSVAELETQVEIAYRLSFLVRSARLDDEIDKVGRMLTALIRRLRAS